MSTSLRHPSPHRAMFRTILLLAALAVSCPAAAQRTSPPLAKAPSQIVAPARVGNYVRGERRDLGSAAAGVAFTYVPDSRSDSSWATVYYYRENYPATMSAARMIAAEVEEFGRTLVYHQAQGEYDQYRMVWSEADSVRAGRHVLPGHRIAYIYVVRGIPVVSTFNVYVAGRTLIKVRGSVPASQFKETRLLGFAEAAPVLTVLSN